jgi:hypothetical protein
MFASILSLFEQFARCHTDPIDWNVTQTISLLARFPLSLTRPHFQTFFTAAFRHFPESSHFDPCEIFRKFHRLIPHFSLSELQAVLAIPAFPRIAAGLVRHKSTTTALLAALTAHTDDPVIRRFCPNLFYAIDLADISTELVPSVISLVSLAVSTFSRDRIESMLEFIEETFEDTGQRNFTARFVLACGLLTVMAAEDQIRSRFCGFHRLAVQAIDYATRNSRSAEFSQLLPALCRYAFALAGALPGVASALLAHARNTVFERSNFDCLVPLVALDAIFGDRLLEDLRQADTRRDVQFAVRQLALVVDVGDWADGALPGLAEEFETSAVQLAVAVLERMPVMKAAEWLAEQVKAGKESFARMTVVTARVSSELQAAVAEIAGKETAAVLWDQQFNDEEQEDES